MDENTGRWPSWELAEVKWLFEWRVWSKQFSGRKESWMFEIQFGRWKGRHGSDGKESACTVGDPGSIPGSGRSSGEGNGNPLQDSCLENTGCTQYWLVDALTVSWKLAGFWPRSGFFLCNRWKGWWGRGQGTGGLSPWVLTGDRTGDSERAGDKSWEGQWAARPRSFREAGLSPGGKEVVRSKTASPWKPPGEVVLSRGKQESTRVSKKGRNLQNRVLIYRTWLTTSVHFQRAFPSCSGWGSWARLGLMRWRWQVITFFAFFFCLSSLQSVSPQENFNLSIFELEWILNMCGTWNLWNVLYSKAVFIRGRLPALPGHVTGEAIFHSAWITQYRVFHPGKHLVWKILWVSRKLPGKSDELVISILPWEVL